MPHVCWYATPPGSKVASEVPRPLCRSGTHLVHLLHLPAVSDRQSVTISTCQAHPSVSPLADSLRPTFAILILREVSKHHGSVPAS